MTPIFSYHCSAYPVHAHYIPLEVKYGINEGHMFDPHNTQHDN